MNFDDKIVHFLNKNLKNHLNQQYVILMHIDDMLDQLISQEILYHNLEILY